MITIHQKYDFILQMHTNSVHVKSFGIRFFVREELKYLEGMSTEYPFVDLWNSFVRPLQQIDQSVAVV